MKVIDINGELSYEKSIEVFEMLTMLDEEYESIIDANSRVFLEEDMIELEDLRINIFSNGGLSWGCNAICDKINDIKAKGVHVTTQGYGVIASAALRIFIHGNTRLAGESSHFLIHGTQAGFHEDDLMRTLDYCEFLKRKDLDFNKFLVENTNISEELIASKHGSDWWFDYAEALEYGVVTKPEEVVKEELVLTESECIEILKQSGYNVIPDKKLEEFAEVEQKLNNF